VKKTATTYTKFYVDKMLLSSAAKYLHYLYYKKKNKSAKTGYGRDDVTSNRTYY